MIHTCKKAALGFGFAAIVVSVVAFMPRADGGGTVKPGLVDAREHNANGLWEGEPEELYANVTPAGCTVTFKGINKGRQDIELRARSSKVRVKGGWWKRLSYWTSWDIKKNGGKLVEDETLAFDCKAKRRYRLFFLRLSSGGKNAGDITCYYPSSRSWTKKTSINLGDVSRYFSVYRSSSSC